LEKKEWSADNTGPRVRARRAGDTRLCVSLPLFLSVSVPLCLRMRSSEALVWCTNEGGWEVEGWGGGHERERARARVRAHTHARERASERAREREREREHLVPRVLAVDKVKLVENG
jgi:hypothetical protein